MIPGEYPKVTSVYPSTLAGEEGAFCARGFRSQEEGFSGAPVVLQEGGYSVMIDGRLYPLPQALVDSVLKLANV